MKTPRSILVIVLGLLTAAVASAQPAQAPGSAATFTPLDRNELRRHIYVMEGALVRAVSFGASQLNRELRALAPEMVVMSGEPTARGVYLEGYGVYFDVGVPVLHQSMVWSLRTMLGQDMSGLSEALNALKQFAKEAGAANRAAIDSAIARLELQVRPLGPAGSADPAVPSAPGVQVAQGGIQAAPAGANPVLDPRSIRDPNAVNRAYTETVKRELIDAMIVQSLPITIGPDEYVTVGARDNMQRDSLAPFDPQEEVVTILLRIKGSDLGAYRRGQIDREEAKRRVLVQEF
jgi:hypothetical protein